MASISHGRRIGASLHGVDDNASFPCVRHRTGYSLEWAPLAAKPAVANDVPLGGRLCTGREVATPSPGRTDAARAHS